MFNWLKRHLGKLVIFILNLGLVGTAVLAIKEEDKERLAQKKAQQEEIGGAVLDSEKELRTLEGALGDQSSTEEDIQGAVEENPTPGASSAPSVAAPPAQNTPTSQSGTSQPPQSAKQNKPSSSSSGKNSKSSNSSNKASAKSSSNSASSSNSSSSKTTKTS